MDNGPAFPQDPSNLKIRLAAFVWILGPAFRLRLPASNIVDTKSVILLLSNLSRLSHLVQLLLYISRNPNIRTIGHKLRNTDSARHEYKLLLS